MRTVSFKEAVRACSSSCICVYCIWCTIAISVYTVDTTMYAVDVSVCSVMYLYVL